MSLTAELLMYYIVASLCPSADLQRMLTFCSTLRCIAERLLPEVHERTHLQREIVNEKIVFPRLRRNATTSY